MKKVLLIGHIWPYHNMAGNCIYAIARYLPEFGWEPVVLTTPLPENAEPGYRVVEVPYRDMVKAGVRKLGFDTGQSVKKQLSQKLNVTSKKSLLDRIFRLLNEVLTYPDARRGWKAPALKKGAELIEQENIRAIITDNPPVLAQLIARELKQKYRIPWIVYFSHLWSQNNGYSFSPVRRVFDRRLERKTLAHTDLMVSHSEHQAAKQRALMEGIPAISVFEGFSPEEVNDPPARLTEKFTITYTGTFAPGLREPGMLLSALENLIDGHVIERDRVEVRFYGTEETWVASEIEKHGLSGIVRQYGRVPMAVAQAKQRESQVLYNPKWDDP
ncbi:glycosyltransferase, partial [Chloroflexota bacterium]